MRRRDLILGISIALTAPLARAEQGAVPLVAFLSPGETAETNLGAFRRGLNELGYIDGRNIAIATRSADSDYGRLPALAAELVALKPAVIVTNSAPAIRAVKAAAGTIPIVMSVVDDPVALGFAQSLAHPGGNLTGLTILSAEVLGKRLQFLRDVVPDPGCVGVLAVSGNDDPAAPMALDAAAKGLGLTLRRISIPSIDQLPSGFAELERNGCRALLVMSDPLFVPARRHLADLAAQHGVAASYDNNLIVRAGGLMSYGPDTVEMIRRSAAYVDKILKGAKPADLPIEQPTTFHFAVNLKTARALGLTVPQSILARADEVIE
jgi:ABC-type uncharacterized transport system substrate-binding protein